MFLILIWCIHINWCENACMATDISVSEQTYQERFGALIIFFIIPGYKKRLKHFCNLWEFVLIFTIIMGNLHHKWPWSMSTIGSVIHARYTDNIKASYPRKHVPSTISRYQRPVHRIPQCEPSMEWELRATSILTCNKCYAVIHTYWIITRAWPLLC